MSGAAVHMMSSSDEDDSDDEFYNKYKDEVLTDEMLAKKLQMEWNSDKIPR